MYFIFDIGGTHIRAAVSDGESIIRKKIVDTPKAFSDGIVQLKKLHQELIEDAQIKSALCGIAGILEKNKESLFVSPNLPDWSGKPLKEELQQMFSKPVYLENDAALAGLGEAVYGAGKGYRVVMYYTIGTGVGTVRVVERVIDSHLYNMEAGHQIVDIQNKKTLENLVSGGAIEKREGKLPSEITDKGFWDVVAKDLAVGLYNSNLHWGPDCIVLGGGLINQNVLSLEKIQHSFQELNILYPDTPPLFQSQYADESGLYGGIVYLNSI